MKHLMAILGAALLFSLSTASMRSAQERGAGPSTWETDPAKHKSSSQTDSTPEVNAVAKPSRQD